MRLDGYTIQTGVATEPVTLQDAKSFLRVDFTDDDTLITNLITRCRAYAESITRRALATQTIQAYISLDTEPVGRLSGPVSGLYDPMQWAERLMSSPLGMPPFVLRLPFPPVQTVSLIETQLYPTQVPNWTTYAATDSGGNPTYYMESATFPAQVFFVAAPSATRFRVTMTCGYASGFTVFPDDLKMILLEAISFKYDNRGGEGWPDGLKEELINFRVEYR